MKLSLPAQTVAIQTDQGIDPIWYEKLTAMAAFINYFSEVNFKTLTNGQVLIWNDAQKKFLPGAN
ncbi:hypothetical protein ACKWRH_23575 [Bradyrhizobium sp. Pa8]|uniref:hypothetical protein n=1 Tax=Bradyrhizobium sp. Pa8 TaxID=3386552 RepID=UPI00403F2CC8